MGKVAGGGVNISMASVNLTEGEAASSLSIRLDSQPGSYIFGKHNHCRSHPYLSFFISANDVSIVLSNPLGNFTDFTYSPQVVTFSSLSWSTPQYVQTVAVDDDHAEDRTESHEVHAEAFR